MSPIVAGIAGIVAIVALTIVGAALVFAQAASPQGTPAQIERPEPSAKPTKNPTAPHHHYDRRHPHRGAKVTPTP